MTLATDMQEAALLREKLARLTDRIAAQSRSSPAMTEAQLQKLTEHQAVWDSAYQAHRSYAPPPLPGETGREYRQRLARGMQRHSPRWASVNLDEVDDEKAWSVIAGDIINDSVEASKNVPDGELRAFSETDESGRKITVFRGEPNVWMQDFRLSPRRLRRPWFSAHRKDSGA